MSGRRVNRDVNVGVKGKSWLPISAQYHNSPYNSTHNHRIQNPVSKNSTQAAFRITFIIPTILTNVSVRLHPSGAVTVYRCRQIRGTGQVVVITGNKTYLLQIMNNRVKKIRYPWLRREWSSSQFPPSIQGWFQRAVGRLQTGIFSLLSAAHWLTAADARYLLGKTGWKKPGKRPSRRISPRGGQRENVTCSLHSCPSICEIQVQAKIN